MSSEKIIKIHQKLLPAPKSVSGFLGCQKSPTPKCGAFLRIYFGHPVNTYNTEQETDLSAIIQQHFPEYEVENPNQPHHQEGYQRWKAEKGNGMQYYFQEVLPEMAAGIFLAFEDGMLGAGVYGEAESLHQDGKPIYEISLEGKISELDLDPQRFLTIEETRARVYGKKD
ncbi:hypothetical protein GOV03_03930 [Candidatus Woesearchaeota archaeon]|nr:hypothetical protein [Candidatus Woesearchaeota archaeon]